MSYTDYEKDNFDCGHGKFYCEINGEDCDANEEQEVDLNAIAREVSTSADYICGATIINDRLELHSVLYTLLKTLLLLHLKT